MSGLMEVYRSRMSNDAMNNIAALVIPVILNAHARDMRSIIGIVATEYTTPMMPDPDDAIPCARLLFVVNL